jgi:hypothetical protein
VEGAVGVAAYPLLGLWREAEKLAGKKKEDDSNFIASQVASDKESDNDTFLEEDMLTVLEKWQGICGKKHA